MATWQQWVEQNLPPGTRETSGYRTPQQEAALGGPASSYHSRGTPEAPGAIDVGGPAAQLKALFDAIKQAFAGRLNELYLNIPAGGSQDIKNNQPLGTNPEAGRPQHLHIAISGSVGPTGGVPPAAAIPYENRGGAALKAAPDPAAGECLRTLCPPDFRGMIQSALGKTPEPQSNCICWSDVWMYGASLALILGGSWMAFLTSRGSDR